MGRDFELITSDLMGLIIYNAKLDSIKYLFSMKTPSEIQEEQSKRIVWVVQTIFSLILARSLLEYRDCLLHPFSGQYFLTTLGLILVYGTVLWSWIDYSYTTVVSPYNFDRNNYERIRFIVDLLIVIIYAYWLFSLSDLQYDNNQRIEKLLISIPVIFLFYFFSGILRRIKYGKRSSRISLIIIFGVLFLISYISYKIIFNSIENKLIVNITFIVISMSLMVLYRVVRTLIFTRKYWIAFDIDGVIANQIDSVLPVINSRYDLNIKYNDVIQWDLPVGDSNISDIIIEEQNHKHYVLSMSVIKGAVEALNNLIEKYYVAIITSRTPASDSWTKKWLDQNKIPYDGYENTKEGHKHNSDYDVKILVDDYQKNILEFLDRTDGFGILFSQPWNQNLSALNRFIDEGRLFIARDWHEVVEYTKKITK